MAPRDKMARTRQMNDLVLRLAEDEPWHAMRSVHLYDGGAALEEVDRVLRRVRGVSSCIPTHRSSMSPTSASPMS